MARIGFLGTGTIAEAMVRGLAGQRHEIAVSERTRAVSARLAAEIDGVTVASNAEVVAGSDIVVVCLLARVAETELPGLPFRAGQAVVSVMADMGLARLLDLCAPATDVAVAIPLPTIASGGSHMPMFPASEALVSLYGARNHVFAVPDEAALNAHFAATALCSAMLAQVGVASEWLAQFTGDPRGAEAYVLAILRGALADAAGPDGVAGALAGLATEGGLNATLRAHMRGAETDLRDGLDAFRPRLHLPPVGEPR